MFCKNCGTENRNDSKFCLNCGEKLPDYTKPRENLLMPEDLKDAQITAQKKQTFNRIALCVDIISWIVLIVATAFLALSFFKIKFASIITSLVLYAIYFVLVIIKVSLKKKSHNLDKNVNKK